MKKLSIIILSLILLFCFVSCEKDKSEEMIANYEAFMKAYKVCYETWYALPKTTTADMSTDETVGKEKVQDILNAIDSENSNIEVIDATDHSTCPITKSGSVTVTKDENKKTYTYNITINYSYIKNLTVLADTLTISGTYEETETTSKASVYNSDVKCKITINGTTYEITYYQDYTRSDKFTSATVNGNTVELRLLNAPYQY